MFQKHFQYSGLWNRMFRYCPQERNCSAAPTRSVTFRETGLRRDSAATAPTGSSTNPPSRSRTAIRAKPELLL